MKIDIILGKTFINSVQSNGGVFYGENDLKGWKTHSKSNSATGRVNGDGNIIASRLNVLNDPDFMDTMIKSTLS